MSPIERAAAALAAGRVVVIPTDTVYGVAALPARESAVAEIFRLKQRPPDKALPILGATADELRAVADFDDRARRLAARCWPGPLTLVLPRAPGFDGFLGGDAETVAVRVPDHPIALELLAATGPLAVTSANRSGSPEARTATEARAALGPDVEVLDGGRCDGRPSTVLSLVGEPRVLRPGDRAEEILQIVTA